MSLASRGPMLEGVRIVDLTSVLFGPYSTQILADLGAEVIKIESPQGDSFRFVGKPAKTRSMGPAHMSLNRGKSSVALDLKQRADFDLLCGLLKSADIFIHNVRDRAIGRLGLDYEAVKAIRPDIIYVHCVGFGSDGPYAALPAYDDVIQAASGATSLAPRVDGDPRPRYIPSAIADKVAGLYAANAMLAAIVHLQRTGHGQKVEVPMFETFTHFMLKEHLGGLTFDPPNAPPCYMRQIDPDRQPFPTADGHISIVPYAEDSWAKVFAIVGDPAFLADERVNTTALRFRNIGLLYRRLAELTPRQSTAYWLAAFEAADIPALKARDIADIQNDPHLQTVGFFSRREHPTEGSYFCMKDPITYSNYHPGTPAPPPHIGEHTERFRRGFQQERDE